MSVLLTGDENNYFHIKEVVADFLLANKSIFNYIEDIDLAIKRIKRDRAMAIY